MQEIHPLGQEGKDIMHLWDDTGASSFTQDEMLLHFQIA